MGVFFTGSELLNIAISIEKNGAAFYGSLVELAGDGEAREMYRQLAAKEREHMDIFQKMLASVADYQPPETFTEEYDAYLKALVDSAVFTNDQVARETAQKAGSDMEAIQIGLRAEKDSIIFYYEMREVVRKQEREAVDRIIEEEKSHVRQLLDLQKRLG
jgi:rubrerythrin